MKPKGITIFCLIAIGALGAIAAQSASAALPEFAVASYFCDNQFAAPPNQIGQFETAILCQDPTQATQMRGTWWRLPNQLTGENALPSEVALHGVIGVIHITVTCKTAISKGESPAPKSLAKFSIEFRECKSESGGACTTSGSAEGTILTKNLAGQLGYVKKPSSGIAFSSESGAIAIFNCGGIIGEAVVEGCLIAEALPLNSKHHTGELLYAENSEKTGPKWTKFEGGSECVLTVKSKGITGKAWLTDTEKIEYSDETEVKA